MKFESKSHLPANQESDIPEIDVLAISENETNIQRVLIAIEQAKSMVAAWGRNDSEMSDLVRISQVLQSKPTATNIKEAIKFIKSLEAGKQDYN